MLKFIMMVGLPGSGKSTIAEIFKRQGYVIHSSDAIREELTGDVNNQDINSKVFQVLHERVIASLKQGKNTIYDATNINQKRRIAFLDRISSINNVYKVCYYINTSYKDCLERNQTRKKVVSNHVIDNMYKSLQVPQSYEGWNDIRFTNNIIGNSLAKFLEEDLLDNFKGVSGDLNYLNLYQQLYKVSSSECIKDIVNSPQNTPYHTLSIDRHMFKTYKGIMNKIKENKINNKDDQLILIYAAILHDIGKPFCRKTNEETLYDSFIGHENVSAQLALRILFELGYSDTFSLNTVCIIQNHMKIFNMKDSSLLKLKGKIGDRLYNLLIILHECDKNAK